MISLACLVLAIMAIGLARRSGVGDQITWLHSTSYDGQTRSVIFRIITQNGRIAVDRYATSYPMNAADFSYDSLSHVRLDTPLLNRADPRPTMEEVGCYVLLDTKNRPTTGVCWPIGWVVGGLAVPSMVTVARAVRRWRIGRPAGRASAARPRAWAASLGVAVFLAAWWVRGYWVYDEIEWPFTPPGHHFELRTNRGLAQLRVDLDWPMEERGLNWGHRPLTDGYYLWADLSDNERFAGFGANRRPWSALYYGVLSAGQTRLINVPLAAPVLLAMVLPAWRAIAYVRKRRSSRAGRCAVCGYDLRATPERCPECGSVSPGLVGKEVG